MNLFMFGLKNYVLGRFGLQGWDYITHMIAGSAIGILLGLVIDVPDINTVVRVIFWLASGLVMGMIRVRFYYRNQVRAVNLNIGQKVILKWGGMGNLHYVAEAHISEIDVGAYVTIDKIISIGKFKPEEEAPQPGTKIIAGAYSVYLQ